MANAQEDVAPLSDKGKEETLHLEDSTKLGAVATHLESEAETAIGLRSWLVMAGVCFALFSQLFTLTIAGSNVTFIVRDIGGASVASWIVQAPLLMQSAISPFFGRISDEFGRKGLSVAAPALAFIGSVISAKASSMGMLISGAVLVGPTLATISVVQSIAAEIMPMKWRVVSNALAFAGGAFGGISSPRSLKGFLYDCDPIGSVLYVCGASLLLLGLNWSGGTYSWGSAQVLAPFITGVALLIGFGLYEWKGRDDGLIAHELFERGRNFTLSFVGIIIEGWIFYGAVTNIIPTAMVNLGFASTAWDVSVRQIVNTISALLMSLVVMWYATKYKDLRTPLVASFALFLVGNICYATLTEKQNHAQLVYQVIVGLGQAGPLTLMIAAAQLSVPHRYLSTATGLCFSGRAIGGALGSCVLNVIINYRYKQNWARMVSQSAINAGLNAGSVPEFLQGLATANSSALQSLVGNNTRILVAATSAQEGVYAGAYKIAFAATIPLTVVATVTCCFLTDMKKYMGDTVEASVEKRSGSTD
ncbi:hypothetical protein IFR04_015023 [Cadophora malorum]|uniref:Major facilitator superfamily (MFS) profile domain-containing protein n=1 Tax=Cadophora malorum TaxID=108018 RepID=A0A8H7W5R5_9HELO|nr:hypothetical protein IFR04_015023 [Cadophora malorum]